MTNSLYCPHLMTSCTCRPAPALPAAPSLLLAAYEGAAFDSPRGSSASCGPPALGGAEAPPPPEELLDLPAGAQPQLHHWLHASALAGCALTLHVLLSGTGAAYFDWHTSTGCLQLLKSSPAVWLILAAHGSGSCITGRSAPSLARMPALSSGCPSNALCESAGGAQGQAW